MKFRILLLFIWIITASLAAFAQSDTAAINKSHTTGQFIVSGKIISQVDKKPVANASVFLSNASIGGKTGNDGTFTLSHVRPGKYKLVISIVGFENYSQPILINKDIDLPAITIAPKSILLKEVNIKIDKNRDKYFEWFNETVTNELLGPSDLAKDCNVLNPHVLDIDYDEATGTITASSYDFLEIENDALGYKIRYLLTDFKLIKKGPVVLNIHYEGSALFTAMKGTPKQEQRWQQNRRDAYEGSFMHFLRAGVNDQLEEDGFRVTRLAINANPDRPADSIVEAKIKLYQKTLPNSDSLSNWKKKLKLPKTVYALLPFSLNRNEIIEPTDQNGIFALGCENDALLISYSRNHRFTEPHQLADLNRVLNSPYNRESTLLSFEAPYTFFDRNGGIANPNSLITRGVWTKSRVAGLLPVDYDPQSKSSADTLFKNDTLLKSTITKLNAFTAVHPVEKVYLHLDRPYYLPGDTIWYKAYTVVGGQHQLSALSSVLYCELINNKDSVVNRRILKLVSGIAWADFALPRQFKPGNYHIRAYTNWMRNAGTEYFYDQTVRIGGPQPAVISGDQIAKAKPDIQFFPEGGDLINGVRSRVAVKSVNANGFGENINGTITDNDGNEVAAFTTQHLGMGVFALTPQVGKTYKANITCADGSKLIADLPKAREEGFTLALNNSAPDSIYLKVAANDKLFQTKQNSAFYLVAQSGGKVYYTAQARLASPVFTAKIPKDRFPSGIVQFTLFSQNGEPQNERIIFIQNTRDALQIALSSSAQTYTPRQNVKINIDTKNGDLPAAAGTYSVAVINESRVPVDENAESTILNNLLLTSDLKGYIEKPNYYFTHPGDQSRADLDVLMLTQGYRRFEWKQVLNNATSSIAFQPEKSLELAGGIKTPSGKPVPNGKIILTATKESFFTDTTADVNGNFKFTNLDLPDTAKIVLLAKKENNGNNVTIYVKQPDYPTVIKSTVNVDTTIKLTPEMLSRIAEYRAMAKQDSLKNRQLKEVTIKAKKESEPDRFNGYGTRLEYNVDMKRLRGENTLKEALPMLVPGASYNNGKISYEHHTASLVIDGLPHDSDQIDLFLPDELDNIRMVSSTNVYPALLVITTKRAAGTDTASTMLKEVRIKDKRRIVKGPDLSGSQNIHAGAADQVLMGDKVSGCVKLSDCLQGKVFGVSFGLDGTPSNNRIQDKSRAKMSIIVDGNIMPGTNLNDLNADDVYSIEVLRSGAARSIYGTSIDDGGALVITMKHGGESSYVTSASPSGLITYPFKGYYKAKSFYSPKYSHAKTDIEAPDYRSTIYWNPNILTDKDGKASIEYFNADTKGTYRVVVEGIDDNGNPGRQVYRYKVE